MTVKDIVQYAADEIGVGSEVNRYLSGTADAEGERMAQNLLSCFNMVENEVALDYLPLYADETKTATQGKILYSAFSHTPVHIVRIEDGKGEKVKYKLFSDHIAIADGDFKVYYAYQPQKKALNGNSDFTLSCSERLLVVGTVAEYYLRAGLLEEATLWDRRYKDALAAEVGVSRSKTMRVRRWV